MFLTLNCCFWLKYESSIHNIAFSSEKVVSSEQVHSVVEFFFFLGGMVWSIYLFIGGGVL